MRRLVIWLVVMASIVSVVTAQAQDGSRQLKPGVPVSGSIDTNHLTQMYSFMSQQSSESITLQNTGALPLKVVIIDSAGMPLMYIDDITPGSSGSFSNWQPPADGAYYVVVYPTESLNEREGAFEMTWNTLTLTNVSGALQFDLIWQDGARLGLEVRDPQGQEIHWKNPTSSDGGTFSGDTDSIDCATFAPHSQNQAITWPTGMVQAGNYEILVHYIDGCTNALPFSITIRLGNQQFPVLSGVAKSDSTFVGGFVMDAEGTGGLAAQSGEVSDAPALAIQTAQLVSAAEALPADGIVDGQIDNDHAYHSYQFEGKLGETITADVKHTSGNLDTVIALLDTNGNLAALNDDSADDTTDSAINKVRLRHNGTYLIVVTRYAQMIGATTGGFELTVIGVK